MVHCDMQTLQCCGCCQHTSASECASRTSIGPMSVGSAVLSMDAFGMRSFGAFGVAQCVTEEVRDLNGSNASLRRMLRASLVEVLLTMDQRRGPKPACPKAWTTGLPSRRAMWIARNVDVRH